MADLDESLAGLSELPDCGCQQSHASWVCLLCALWSSGSSVDAIIEMKSLFMRAFLSSGLRGVSSLLKGWSNATRSILAVSDFDTTHVGYCKRAKNCRYALRKAGLTDLEIQTVIDRYDQRVGIPPFLLSHPFVRILLPEAPHDVYLRVVSLANIGRASPVADAAKCRDSEISFYSTTSRTWNWNFDFRSISRQYGQLCHQRVAPPHSSRIELSSHSSFQFPRSLGGKNEEIRRAVMDSYLIKTVDDFVPEQPNSDLYDCLGNLVLRQSDWSIGEPITSVFYPSLRSEDGFGDDRRFGLFILDWAIRSLSELGMLDSSSPYVSIGSFCPILRFRGVLESRVSVLPEEGFKARVITITELCVSIVEIVARHFLDPFVRADRMVKIGLLSSVKLYDLMVEISTSRRGVDSFESPSFLHRSALSADLTTSTDTAYRSSISSILEGFCETCPFGHERNIIRLALDVCLSTRHFVSDLCPPNHEHRCGIMMGEAMSGVYLNVMSGIVRAILADFSDEFDHYDGTSVEDADQFILDHSDWIQLFLDNTRIRGFGHDSSQSGDDLIVFSQRHPDDLRRFLILLYRVMGLCPSESTFYSSELFATFTEEIAVKHRGTFGWVFIDAIKPRLFKPLDSSGISSVLSRIARLGNTCKYLRDPSQISRVSDAVDFMIESCPVIRDRVNRYRLVPSFPPALGGLGHPSRFLEGTEIDVPSVDRAVAVRISLCSDEELFKIKYSWAYEDLDDENADLVRSILSRVYDAYANLPSGLDSDVVLHPYHTYTDEKILPRGIYPSHSCYIRDLSLRKKELGLASLDDIVVHVSSSVRLRLELDQTTTEELNPLVKLRRRREFLISRTADLVGDEHDFSWHTLNIVSYRFQASFQGTNVLMEEFLDLLDLTDLPSLSIPVQPFDWWAMTD